MNNERLQNLLWLEQSGELDSAETAELEELLKENPSARKEIEEISQSLRVFPERETQLVSTELNRATLKRCVGANIKIIRFSTLLKIAACVALIVTTTMVLTQKDGSLKIDTGKRKFAALKFRNTASKKSFSAIADLPEIKKSQKRSFSSLRKNRHFKTKLVS